jgi:hypothetical protein
VRLRGLSFARAAELAIAPAARRLDGRRRAARTHVRARSENGRALVEVEDEAPAQRPALGVECYRALRRPAHPARGPALGLPERRLIDCIANVPLD